MIEMKIVLGGGLGPEDAVASLESLVNSHIREGWEMHGQAFIIPDDRDIGGNQYISMAQQMIMRPR
ncbi:hypothetical protein HA052_10955 [Chromobacterium haemolyticum]|uniref:DUF1737 domain-containing protein n=1 Tax=Chromobacterium fluminis TaxID=3044269 RepID=A0ABX0L9Q3_9NEIS|nr:hypothetical protein [Chromobacterium haemolyticum]NHR05718.1 hypothetical protein [Chromobacterium haemolyticum]